MASFESVRRVTTQDVICYCHGEELRSRSRILACIPRLLKGLVLVALTVTAALLVEKRDRLFDWHKFRGGKSSKPYRTVKYSPVRTGCDAVEDVTSARSFVDSWNDGTLWTNTTVLQTVRFTYGLAGLTEQEFVENHCMEDELRNLFNPFKSNDLRRAKECRHGAIGNAPGGPASCTAGLYAHVVNGSVTGVRAAPAGYFAPGAFTCIVRCPHGGFCPQSEPTVRNDRKCRYPAKVDKEQRRIQIENASGSVVTAICPGSRFLYLCPGGYFCKFAETRVKCRRGYRCPRGADRERECDGAKPFVTARRVCPHSGTQYPDYTIPLMLFVGAISSLALITFVATGALANAITTAVRFVIDVLHEWQDRVSYSRDIEPGGAVTVTRHISSRFHNFFATIIEEEQRLHLYLLKRIAGNDGSGVWSGFSATRTSRHAVYGILILFIAFLLYVIVDPLFSILMILSFFVMLMGCFGMCYFDARRAVDDLERQYKEYVQEQKEAYVQDIDDEPPAVFTFCGCTSRANAIVAVIALIFFVVAVFFGNAEVGLIAFFVLCITGIGVACLCAPNGCPSCSFVNCCCCMRRYDRRSFAQLAFLARQRRPTPEFDAAEGRNSRRRRRSSFRVVSMRSEPSATQLSSPGGTRIQPIDLRIDLSFTNLRLTLRSNSGIILDGASGTISAGNLTAVMGPSGAGKTSLLNALSDKAYGYAEVSGERCVNGRTIHNLREYSNFTAFVPQDDIMLSELTVRQALEFYAEIRAWVPLTRSEVEQRACEAMRIVELPETIWDSVIGDAERRGLSGGQKKRVSIAMELVAQPSLLFLDEPTSGLDSTTSAQVVSALCKLAIAGVNVIAVLHQPSFTIFSRFSKVLLLGAGGRTVYHDDPTRVVEYFTEELGDGGPVYELPPYANPADVAMDIISGVAVPVSGHEKYRACPLGNRVATAKALSELWIARSSNQSDDSALPLFGFNPAAPPLQSRNRKDISSLRPSRPFLTQCRLFARRAALQEWQRPGLLLFDVVLMGFFGLLFGSLSRNVTVGGLPVMILWLGIGMQLFLAVSVLRVFGNERLVFWREASLASGMALSPAAYFLGKDIVQIPRLCLLVLSFTAVFYTFAAPSPTFLHYYSVLGTCGYVVAGYAYVISIVLEPKASQLFAVVLALVLTAMSGVGSEPLRQIHRAQGIRIIPWLAPIRWAGESLIVAQTRQLSHAWKMSTTFYLDPRSDSALAILFAYGFTEGWLQDIKVSRRADYAVCRVKGVWRWAEVWNFWMLLVLGFSSRLVACFLLMNLHREKLGEPPLSTRLARALRQPKRAVVACSKRVYKFCCHRDPLAKSLAEPSVPTSLIELPEPAVAGDNENAYTPGLGSRR